MIIDWLKGFDPVVQALFATLFTWGVTALGASLVFFFKNISRKVLNGMLGFAAGVMIAASFWSLLAPAIEMAELTSTPSWIPAAVGFLAGGGFLLAVDKILPHLHLNQPIEQAEGIKTSWQRSILLVLAITLHNIPEGLAVGVAFGAVAANIPSASLAGAVALAVGIGIQNFPEGAAVSIPLRREGFSRFKSFMYGQASGIVEPIAGVIGAFAVIAMKPILPYALSFAAGAMIFVVVEELIPESQQDSKTDISTIGAMVGFVIMMILDVALG
ncbi:ZIP family metal transporter [Clostridium sp. CM028]|uniref:ZIP family metal transporter n=1 Tax=unclassified Clostridium TaxID=2614128 RepID=UPI001C0CD6D0|nr:MULTISPECIES: ZIP family metal transporter [unclassified Clostridium]MBU3092095.1 ZIP family metal transporter [Clostridium sp. CF011]MBW9148975.1 ZIP family metal transporter [Clostridium sp. CM028]WAG71375.1 ZIP family metal transporter [Clostridium sp. CF011]WLC62928.1 ZIP family metal transporter [Clostridium sp. CM028]